MIIIIKMKKITVSDIKSLTSIPKNSEQIFSAPCSKFLSIQSDTIITLSQPLTLIVTNLNEFKTLFKKDLSLAGIKNDVKIRKLVKCGNLLGIVFENYEKFYCCDIGNGGVWGLEGHMDAINDVLVYDGCFVTASKDMTVRLWQIQEGNQEKPIKFPIALKGHKGSVQTLCVYHNFLLSGSDDKTLICWHNRQLYTSLSLPQRVVKLQPCPLSSQILAITHSNTLNFIPIKSLLNKKPQIRCALTLTGTLSRQIETAEIDQSFAVVVEGGVFRFVEINLGKEMHQVGGQQGVGIGCGLRCEGRCVFYGVLGVGVMLLKI